MYPFFKCLFSSSILLGKEVANKILLMINSAVELQSYNSYVTQHISDVRPLDGALFASLRPIAAEFISETQVAARRSLEEANQPQLISSPSPDQMMTWGAQCQIHQTSSVGETTTQK